MENKEYFTAWSEKLSIPIETIETEFSELIAKEKTIHPEDAEEKQSKRALQLLNLRYKKQLRSPAIGFEGMVIGVGDMFDMVRKMRLTAIEAYKTNPHQAIQDNLTDSDGTPLDPRAVFGTGRENSEYGKPLPEHSYIRNIVGVALRMNTEEAPKLFSMTLNGDKAEHLEVEMFKPVRFRAINKSEENSPEFTLNGSTVTTFTTDNTISMPNPIEVLRKVCGNKFVPLSKAQEYHSANKDDWNRLAFIEGDVSILSDTPTKVGSRMMVIEDMEASLEDLGIPGMTCWIPKSLTPDFAEGSKVIAIGKTAQGQSRDDPNVLGDVMMNIVGIYALPEYKIEPVVVAEAEEQPEEKAEPTPVVVDDKTEETKPTSNNW